MLELIQDVLEVIILLNHGFDLGSGKIRAKRLGHVGFKLLRIFLLELLLNLLVIWQLFQNLHDVVLTFHVGTQKSQVLLIILHKIVQILVQLSLELVALLSKPFFQLRNVL